MVGIMVRDGGVLSKVWSVMYLKQQSRALYNQLNSNGMVIYALLRRWQHLRIWVKALSHTDQQTAVPTIRTSQIMFSAKVEYLSHKPFWQRKTNSLYQHSASVITSPKIQLTTIWRITFAFFSISQKKSHDVERKYEYSDILTSKVPFILEAATIWIRGKSTNVD